jgi:hypothetical protein
MPKPLPTEIVWALCVLVLVLTFLMLWLVREIKADRRRRHIAEVLRKDRARRMGKSLTLEVEEPQYPGLARPEHRGQHSTNENSPEFHALLKDLRFTHFWKSEAWRWEEAHRQLRKIRKSG